MIRRRTVASMGLVLLVLVAGCAAAPWSTAPEATETATPAGTTGTQSDATVTTAPASTATPTPTATPSPTPTPYLNPWHQSTVVVAVDDAAVTPGRDVVPLVRAAIDYWEAKHQYPAYDVSFVLDPDAENPDLVVQFSSEVLCGGNGTAIGCAPLITPDSTVDTRPQWIGVQTGFVNETTLLVIKHEFGHVLGLDHGDPPTDVMAARVESTALAAPNVSERLFPWKNRTLSVYIEDENLALGGVRSIRKQQIRDGLTFYESDRDDGWIDDVSFVVVDDEDAADVVISASANPGCDDPSCGSIYGIDTDDDGALEFYTYAEITIYTGTEDDQWAWNVAYWLGYALGADDYDDLPDDLREGDRSGSWWTE